MLRIIPSVFEQPVQRLSHLLYFKGNTQSSELVYTSMLAIFHNSAMYQWFVFFQRGRTSPL